MKGERDKGNNRIYKNDNNLYYSKVIKVFYKDEKLENSGFVRIEL